MPKLTLILCQQSRLSPPSQRQRIRPLKLVQGVKQRLFNYTQIRMRIFGSGPMTNGSGADPGGPKTSGPDSNPDPEHWYIYIIHQR
jgi:hypothetical protein